MAQSSATVWEVRPTVGSDTNGGGFTAGAGGTDYSQQNAKNSVGNNISTTDAVAVGTTTLTSATASFTAAIVGNVIYLAGSGATTGWYRVVTYTNGTTVVLDRSPGSGTGWTMNIGGALATISAAVAAAVAENTVYVKASGTYTVTTSLTLPNVQNNNSFFVIGYTTARGDGGHVTWTTATNNTPLILSGGTTCFGYVFENFNFTTSAGTKAACFDGSLNGAMAGLRIVNCVMTGFTNGVKGTFSSGVNWDIIGLFMESCVVTGCSSYGVGCSGVSLLVDCYIYSNTGIGVTMTETTSSGNGGPLTLVRCIVYDNGSHGISTQSGTTTIEGGLWVQLINCAVVANTGDGIHIGSSTDYNPLVVMNTIIESQGGYGINSAGGTGLYVFYANAYRANSSGDLNGPIAYSPTDIMLSAEPFTTVGSNWTLNSTAGGGALCSGAGYPSSIP